MKTALRHILSEIRNLEPLPQVALRVLEIGAQEEVGPNDLIDVLKTDPGLTAKVLRLCNSAFYGFQREIASLSEAGNLLGVSTLTNLVLTSCTGRYFRDYGKTDMDTAMRLWEGCVGNALAAQMVAASHGTVDADRAYTAGLLQNMGHLVIDRFVAPERDRLRAVVAHGMPLLEAEKRLLGMSHAEIGARLARHWSFPDVLVDTILHHHTPERAREAPGLAWVVHVGDYLNAAAHEEAEDRLRHDLESGALERTGLSDREVFEALCERLRRDLERATGFVEAA
jgi:HD-like signal output (HDOD) protein